MGARAASNFIIIVTLFNIQQNTPRKCKDKSKFQNTTFWLVAIQKWNNFYFPSFEDFIGKGWVYTLCRSKVWIGMKVLQANSIILSTRKMWWIFPIKQKLDVTEAFLDNPKCSIWPSLVMLLTVVFLVQVGCTMVKKRCQKYSQIWQVLNIFTIAASN